MKNFRYNIPILILFIGYICLPIGFMFYSKLLSVLGPVISIIIFFILYSINYDRWAIWDKLEGKMTTKEYDELPRH